MGILDAIHEVNEDAGIAYLREYYVTKKFTGSYFESLGARSGFDDSITGADLYALSTLDIKVPVRAGISILEEESTTFNGPLKAIPKELTIGSLSESEFEQHLGAESKALELWNRLRRNGLDEDKWGVGPTTASKIMARKRPHLIPIEDSIVNQVIELGRGDSWRLWWEAFQAEGDYLEERATKLRAEIGRPELSTLRVFDVMLWMWGKANLPA